MTAEFICSAAIQTLGGYGYVKDFPLERIYCNVRVCEICEGTSDSQKIMIQRAFKELRYSPCRGLAHQSLERIQQASKMPPHARHPSYATGAYRPAFIDEKT